MPATVTLDLLDTTDAGIAAFAKSIDKAGESLSAAEKKAAAFNREINSRAANRAAQAEADEVRKMADQYEEAAGIKKKAGGAGSLGIRAEQVTAGIAAFKLISEWAGKARQAISMMASEGHESFIRIEGAVKNTEGAFKNWVNRAAEATGAANALATAADNAAGFFDFISGTNQQERNMLERQIENSKRYAAEMRARGLAAQAAADSEIKSIAEVESQMRSQQSTIDNLHHTEKDYTAKRIDGANRLINLEAKKVALLKEQAQALDWLNQRAAESDRSKELTDIHNSIDANNKLNDALREYRNLAADINATAEQRSAAQKKVAELTQKQAELVKQESDWVKKAKEIDLNSENELWDKKVRRIETEEEILKLLREERKELDKYTQLLPKSASQAEEYARKREQSLNRVKELQKRISDFEQQDYDVKRRREDAEMQARGKAHQEQLQQANDRMKKALEERQAKINALAEQVKPAVQQAKANINDRQKLTEVLRIRQERAKKQVLGANKGKMADEVNKKLKEAERRTKLQFQADMRRTMKPPRQRLTRDGKPIAPRLPKPGKGGPMQRAVPIDPLEVEQATNDLVRRQIDNAANQGKFAGDTAAAIKAAADAQQKASETMILHDQELQGIKQKLEAIQGMNATTNNNARQRAMGR